MSASVDELRATVENMTLSSVGQMMVSLLVLFVGTFYTIFFYFQGRRGSSQDHDGMKRSQSVSQQIGG